MFQFNIQQVPYNAKYRATVQIAGRYFETGGESRIEAVHNLLSEVQENESFMAISYSTDLDEILAMGREALLEGSAATVAKVATGWFGIALRGGVTAVFLAVWFKGVRELQAEVDRMENGIEKLARQSAEPRTCPHGHPLGECEACLDTDNLEAQGRTH